MSDDALIRDAYRAALMDARARGYQLGGQNLAALEDAFKQAIRDLARLSLSDNPLTAARAESLRVQLIGVLERLEARIAIATQRGVALTISDIVGMHEQVTQSLAARLLGAGTAQTLGIAARFDVAATRAASILASLRPAASFTTLIRRHLLDAAPDLDRLLIAGVARGQSSRSLARDIVTLLRERTPADLRPSDVVGLRTLRSDARRIAVSEINNSMREANRQALIESPIAVAGRWSLSGNHPAYDVCDLMATADLFGLGAGFYPVEYIPLGPHPWCFPGTTTVEGSFTAACRSQYSGDMLELVTRSGKVLTITPNHPVLTPAGFRRAGELREGDSVVGYPSGVNVPSIPRADHPQNPPVVAQDVFSAFEESGAVAAAEWSAEYLHGDARNVKGNIDVVRPDRVLLLDGMASLPHRLGHFALVGPLIHEPLVSSAGLFEHLDPWPRGAAHRRVSGADAFLDVAPGVLESLPFKTRRFREGVRSFAGFGQEVAETGSRQAGFARELADRFSGAVSDDQSVHRGGNRVALRVGAQLDAMLSKPAGEDARADTRFARQLCDRFSASVSVDQIVQVRHFNYQGHVYDLESDRGHIIADGIVISNCRCTITDIQFRPPSDWGAPKPPAAPLLVSPAALAVPQDWTEAYSASQRAAFVNAMQPDVRRRRAA